MGRGEGVRGFLIRPKPGCAYRVEHAATDVHPVQRAAERPIKRPDHIPNKSNLK